MKKNTQVIYLAVAVFVVAFIWQLCLTYGFDFFWEDFELFRIHKQMEQPGINLLAQLSTVFSLLIGFIKELFSPIRLFQAGFSSYSHIDRPYQFLVYDLLSALFHDKAILYRILKSIIFAINTCVIFLIINRVSRLLSIFGAFLYMTAAEIWISITYASDVGPFTQCGTLLSILFFIKLIEQRVDYKKAWFYYLFIFLTSNFAIFSKGDGRYLAFIFLITILLFRRKEFRFHVPMLFILLFLEIPILGFIKMFFSKASFHPIDLSSHENSSLSLIESLKLAASNYRFPQNAIGALVLVALAITILVHLWVIIFKQADQKNPSTQFLAERTFLFLLWFIIAFLMTAIVRGFSYDGPYSFQLCDLAYLIAPSIIFVCYYITFVTSGMKKNYAKPFLMVCLVLLTVQILGINLLRLNRFRAGWVNYFLAWQNCEKYINKKSDNALVLAFTEMHYKPFIFRSSNNVIMNTTDPCEQSEFCDLNFIEGKFKEGGYGDIFVIGNEVNKFRGNSKNVILYQTNQVDSDIGDIYSCFKNMVLPLPCPGIQVFHFKFKEN